MGYSVKYSTTDAQKELTAMDKHLRGVTANSLATLSKICRNIHSKPKEEKYRRLRLTNEKIISLIVDVPGCLEALGEMGWEKASGCTLRTGAGLLFPNK